MYNYLFTPSECKLLGATRHVSRIPVQNAGFRELNGANVGAHLNREENQADGIVVYL
jgi:hypothetical protein